MPVVAILFGWPAAIVSVLFGVLGVLTRQWPLLFLGLIAGAPFLFYLSLNPGTGWAAFAVAMSYLAAVIASYRRRTWLAAALFAPMILFTSYIGTVVSRQVRW